MAVPAATYTPGAGKERRRRRESSLVRLWHGELTFQERRMVEWCLATLALTLASFTIELQLRGLAAFLDNLIVCTSCAFPLWLAVLAPPRSRRAWLPRCPYLCALACVCVFADYVIDAEAIDWDEYGDEDSLERQVETSRSRHTMLVCLMLVQLGIVIGLLFVARSAVSLISRIEIDARLAAKHAAHARKGSGERARGKAALDEALVAGGTCTAVARADAPPAPAATLAERATRGDGARDAAHASRSSSGEQSVEAELPLSARGEREWRFTLGLPRSLGGRGAGDMPGHARVSMPGRGAMSMR